MAFPDVTTLIDDFNRANGTVQAAPGNSIWTALNLAGGAGAGSIVSNQLRATAGGGCRSALTWAPPYDFQFDVPVLPGAGQYIAFYWGVQNPGATYTCYALLLLQGSPFTWQFRKYIAAVRTTIVSPTSAFLAGDRVGIRQNGTTIEFWRYTGAPGAWTQIMSRVDSSIAAAAGPVAFEFGDTVGRVDNLLGGTVVPASSTRLAMVV